MSVRSKQLAFSRVSAQGLSVIYTAPANETVIVKEWARLITGTGKVYFGVQRGANRRYTRAETVNTESGLNVAMWTVLLPGDQLVVNLGAGIVEVDSVVSGTELEGVAD